MKQREGDAAARLAKYKQRIDDDIAVYTKHIRDITRQQYGQRVAGLETEVFLDVLARGGKRIRGALVLAGYEMCGGTNQAMAVAAARAIEMLHAYILMVDDVQDRSALRRGKPTAHLLITERLKKEKLHGDLAHAGMAIALNAALAGAHAAQNILANLDAPERLRLSTLSIVNRTMAITAHGQTLDIFNQLADTPSEPDIQRVLEWKTALYTVINPLHVGMVLAGADCRATDAITPYATHAGTAFQITDDILGIFGTEHDLGKTPGDDIREGKGTVLTLYALQHAQPADAKFLRACLGKPDLTAAEFARCQETIRSSGALAHAQATAAKYLNEAVESLSDIPAGLWSQDGTAFLASLARALHNRVA